MFPRADILLRQPRRVDDRQTAKITPSSGYDLCEQQQRQLCTMQRRRRMYGYRLLRVHLCGMRNTITRNSLHLFAAVETSSKTEILTKANEEE